MTDQASNNRKSTGSTGISAIRQSFLTRLALPALLAGIVLFFDVSFPLGVAGGVPYVALVLLGLTSSHKNDVFALAAAGSVLTVAGYHFSAEGGIHWVVLTNRGLALFAIWVTAVLCYQHKFNQEKLQDSHDRLEEAVEERTVELRKTNDELRLAQFTLDHAVDTVFWVGEDGRFEYVNQSGQRLLGYSWDELSAMHIWEVDPGVAEADWPRIWARVSRRDQHTFETAYLTRDGSRIPVEVTTTLVSFDDRVILCSLSRDITERRQTEHQLRQAQKMEVIGQLTGGVAHDFNNLLTIILGNLELLDRKLEDREMSDMVQTAIKASRRSAELTQRLLAFSRKQMLAPEVIDLNGHIIGMTDLMRRTLGETIEIDVMSGDDLWKCKVDPGQFENVVLNLAINARDAMRKGGRLTIKTENIHLDDSCPATLEGLSVGDYVMVSVSDTGTGMSADIADRAFEPFFTTKKVGEGSGLGLSMVFGFIKQSGGHVSIASKEGAGTTLELYLPRSVGTNQPAWQTLDAGEPVSRGERILVVEDDAEVRALVINILGGLGYDVVEAGDGREAITALQRTPAIDLLFTDVVLPGGLSGADIAVEATRRVPGIKVLYASGYADDNLVQDGNLDAGVQFINKPFHKADLAQKVRAVLDGAPA